MVRELKRQLNQGRNDQLIMIQEVINSLKEKWPGQYQDWRSQVKVPIENLNITPRLKGLYLHRVLKGRAKEYVGTRDWTGRDEELWTKLDDRYADKIRG